MLVMSHVIPRVDKYHFFSPLRATPLRKRHLVIMRGESNTMLTRVSKISHNVIINKLSFSSLRYRLSYPNCDILLRAVWFTCSQILQLFSFPIFRLWVYFMKVIPERCFPSSINVRGHRKANQNGQSRKTGK